MTTPSLILNEAINDNVIIGGVVAEPPYEDDDYKHINHTDQLFDGPYNMWCLLYNGGMHHDNMGVECVYFTGINFSCNNLSFNPDPEKVYPEVAREMARRPTLNAPSNSSSQRFQVAVKRVSLLLNKPQDYTPMVLDTFEKMDIHSCHALHVALTDTQDNQALAYVFKR